MQMTTMIQDAIYGTLPVDPSQTSGTHTYDLTNYTAIPLNVYVVSPTSSSIRLGFRNSILTPGGSPALLTPNQSVSWALDAGYYVVFTSALSGAFVGVLECLDTTTDTDNADLSIDATFLLNPNDIGPTPAPSWAAIIPTDSPHVLIGCGTTTGGNFVTREQYWTRRSDSHSLSPGETLTVSYTVTQGMQSSSSSQSTMEAALGVSGSAGWGPVSASASGSISKSSTSLQQVMATEESTVFTSTTVSNPPNGDPQMLLYWQLMDVVTVFNSSYQPLGSIVNALLPVVITTSDPGKLTPPWQ